MNGIVHGAIHQVAQDKTRKEHKCLLAYNEICQSENGRSNNKAWHRGHKKPLFVTRIMVVITMQCVNKFLRAWAFTHPMKKKPVSKIFKQCPEKHATDKCQYHANQRKAKCCIAVIQHKADHRKIHAPDYQWVGLGKHLQVIIFKETGLAFVMNFLELHCGEDTKKLRFPTKTTKTTKAKLYFAILLSICYYYTKTFVVLVGNLVCIVDLKF